MTGSDPKYVWADGTTIEDYDVIKTDKGALVVINSQASYEYPDGTCEEGVLCVPARIVNDEG